MIAGQEWPPPSFRMYHPKAVAIDDHIYMGGGYASNELAATVLEMELQSGNWNEIKNCPVKYFGMTVLKKQLFVVGGISTMGSGSKVGDVYTLDMTSKEWNLFPCDPMKEKRSTVSVVTYADKWLFAIGGKNSSGTPLNSIERLNTEDPEDQRHWILCPKLPTKRAQLSSTAVGNKLFIFVTTASSMEVPSNRVYCGRLDVLVYSDESYRDFPWQEITGVPSKSSTPLSYSGSLLALGGFESEYAPTSCVYKLEFHPTTEGESPKTIWKELDNLPHPLYQCAATKITDQIFVYGMCNDSKSAAIHHVYLHTLNEN